MSSKAIKYLKDSNIAIVFAAFALVAEIITAIIVSIMSILFHGRIGNDFLITGAIAAFVATLGTTQVTYLLLKELREGDRITEMLTFNGKILNTSSIGIFTYDASGQCIFANEAAAVIFGTNVADLLSQNFHQIQSWKQSEMYGIALKALTTDIEQQAEVHIVSTSGKSVWLNLRFSSFHANGEKHLLMFCHDITERKLAEEALRSSEQKFMKAFNATPDAIVISRVADGRLIEVNETFLRMTGFSREEVLNRSTVDLNLWIQTSERERYVAAIREHGNVRDFEAQFRTRTGAVLDSLVSADSILLGGEQSMLSIIRDVTGRKKIEQELKQHRMHLEEMVTERTAELKAKIEEIENMNNLFVDRELRMIELKSRIKELESGKQ